MPGLGLAAGSARVALAIACCAVRWQGASAWANRGHQRIAEVTKRMIKPSTLKRVDKLIGGDLLDFADWELTMGRKYPETDKLHWHRQDPEWTCTDVRKAPKPGMSQNIFGDIAGNIGRFGDDEGTLRCDGHGAEGGSLFCALVYFFEHFAHDALLNEYRQPLIPLGTPPELKALAKVPKAEQTPANYLRWLVNLMGDMHQPLHWLRKHNASSTDPSSGYGNDIFISYRGQAMSLLVFWENYVAESMPPLPSQETLERQYANRVVAWWDKHPGELFRIWAREEAEALCNQVYAPIFSATVEEGKHFEVDEALYKRWQELGTNYIILGGQRLAFILSDIVEHTKHKKAHQEGRGRHHRKKRWQEGFFTNFAIGVVVVPSLLVLLTMHHSGSLRGIFMGSTAKQSQ